MGKEVGDIIVLALLCYNTIELTLVSEQGEQLSMSELISKHDSFTSPGSLVVIAVRTMSDWEMNF